jgi:hypothetical protein
LKLTQKAQQLIEYMLLMAAVVAGVLGVAGPSGPMKGAVERSMNRAVETIYGEYFWDISNTTACSVSPGCGPGTQTRTVKCKSGAGDIVEDGLCAGRGPKPLETVDCYIACGGNNWWQSGFGACSQACGPGTQIQTVECRDSGGNKISDASCAGAKPPLTQPCNNPCYQWHSGTECIGPCSDPCGNGSCARSVTCQSTQNGEVSDDSNCNALIRPVATIQCPHMSACGYQWIVQDWSNCSETCGAGVKNRDVECRRLSDGASVDVSSCLPNGPAPANQQACNLGPCNHWEVVGTWGTCTKPCNDGVPGTQTADIKCFDKNGVQIADTDCDDSGPRPSSTRNCNVGACTWGMGAYGACSQAVNCGTDGIKTRDVWCYQAGYPAVHVTASFCGSTTPDNGTVSCTNPPDNSICTEATSCSVTSNCCGNGTPNVFPAIPYIEQCDDGSANNGVCPNTCGAGCTFNTCPCTFTVGSVWGIGCSADATVTAAHGGSATANDATGTSTGTWAASCNNGSWTVTGQTCDTCSDGIQNQGETAADCGGPCPACGCTYSAGSSWGAGCTADATVNTAHGASATAFDTSGNTTGSRTATCDNGTWNVTAQPCYTCSDGIQNQSETGVDCGVPCSPCPCTFTAGSGWGAGCTANATVNAVHNASATAEDTVGTTTGTRTATCDNGTWNITSQPCYTCADGIINQGETAVDCGGPCTACPTCFDTIQNQGETGVDCGGPCPSCAINGVCNNSVLWTCSVGNAVNGDAGSCGGNSTWQCTGSGGGSTDSCSKANAPCVINGLCNNSVLWTCSVGNAVNGNAGSCGGNSTWQCTGSGGGNTDNCSKANAPCPINGVCNNSVLWTCAVGNAINGNAGSCGGSSTWQCAGSSGGSTDSCSKANAPCPINGVCNNSVLWSCSVGNAVNGDAGSCGGNATWQCTGSSGGSTDSCAKPSTYCSISGTTCSGGVCVCPAGANYIINGVCYSQCACRSCAALGWECGSACGVSCGPRCPPGTVCSSGICREPACFIAETKVLLANGQKVAIASLRVGDMIQGLKGANEVREILEVKHESGELYGFNGGEAFVTDSHPFMTTKGWKSLNPKMTNEENPQLNATMLEVGDELITRDGKVLITIIDKKATSIHKVYNLVVGGDNQYYADGYLVHNKPQR